MYTMRNEEVWAFLFVWRVDGVNDQDFCRQVQALTSNPDIATLVRLSAEGTKGLYVLLPPRCDAQQ